jgi:transcriptional regulator with XRE-family HTH domain
MLARQKYTQIVGNNIRAIREKKGIKQDELSAMCGFYRTYINLVEQAKRSPSSYSLYRIAKALRVDVGDLYPSTV